MNDRLRVTVPGNNNKTETSILASLHRERVLLIIALLLMLNGCCPLRRFNKDCRLTKDSLLVSTNTVTVCRDTIISVPVHGDSVTKILPVIFDSDSMPFSGISALETPLAQSKAWVSKGKLIHKLLQKDTIIKKNIKDALRNTSVVTEKKQVLVQTKVINEPTKWQWFQIYMGRSLLIILIMWSILRVLKIFNH